MGAADTSSDPKLAALGALEKKVTARREERSFVVTVAASSESAEKAALIARTDRCRVPDRARQSRVRWGDARCRLADGPARRTQGRRHGRRRRGCHIPAAERSRGEQWRTRQHADPGIAQHAVDRRAPGADFCPGPPRGADRSEERQAQRRRNPDADDGGTAHAVRPHQAGSRRGRRHLRSTASQSRQRRAAAGGTAGADRCRGRALRAVDRARSRSGAPYRGSARNQHRGRPQHGRHSTATASVQLRELERDATAKSAVYEAFLNRAGEITERQAARYHQYSRHQPRPRRQQPAAGRRAATSSPVPVPLVVPPWVSLSRWVSAFSPRPGSCGNRRGEGDHSCGTSRGGRRWCFRPGAALLRRHRLLLDHARAVPGPWSRE